MTRRRLIAAHLLVLLLGTLLTVLAATVPLLAAMPFQRGGVAWRPGFGSFVPDFVPGDDARLWRATRLSWIPETPSNVRTEQPGLFLSRVDLMTDWRTRARADEVLTWSRPDMHVHDRLMVLRAGFPVHAFEGGLWVHSSRLAGDQAMPRSHIRAARAHAWERRGNQVTYVPSGIRWDGFAICVGFWSTIVWLPTLGLRALNRTLRRRRGECPECGYDLARAGHASCPECGGTAPDATVPDDCVVAATASDLDGAPPSSD